MSNGTNTAQSLETLKAEVKKFADELSYWAKFLAKKILSDNDISDNDIDTSYSYLLEQLKLKEEAEKPEIAIDYNVANIGNYKTDLLLTKLENIEGVNALTENQTIEFSPNLTIIYGANGSGKSGYVRLLKNAFYSKAPEEIFKTLVAQGNKTGILVAVIPSNRELDLKKIAQVSGNKKVEMLPLKDLEQISRAYNKALKYLSVKDYTEQQMRKKLMNSGDYDDAQLDATIQLLSEKNLINDHLFTLNYFYESPNCLHSHMIYRQILLYKKFIIISLTSSSE